MAARGNCLSNLLGQKLMKRGLICENNNYIFVKKSWIKRLDLGCGATYALIGVISVLCYFNSLKGDFVHDDLVAIVRNPDITGGSLFGELWIHDFWGKNITDNKSHKSYRPLTTITFRYAEQSKKF